MKKTPGVADNKSYKDMYHFNSSFYPDTTIEDMPSLNVDPKINTTIKENPYRSNVEIEKDEVILQPDLSALFKAMGKKHSGGGIDVALRPDAFVFSDDKSLAFGEKDHKLFEFKKGGSFAPDKNTPADVLKRNVDVKHYNTLVANIMDIKKDDLAKKSSTLMLEKYIKTLGNIAYLQEVKKDFPQGMPSFSEGTAPVYNAELKDEVMEQKQYAKYGGTVMQGGGRNPFRYEQTARGIQVPPPVVPPGTPTNPYTGRDRTTGKLPPYPGAWSNYYDNTRKTQYNAPDWIDPNTFYNTPGLIDYMKTLNIIPGVDNDMNKADDAVWGYRHQAALDKFYPSRGKISITPGVQAQWPEPPQSPAPNPRIEPGTPTGGVDKGRDINWQFSPWQKVSQAYNLSKLASVKKYVPYRSHLIPSYVDPALVNPEQAIGDMKGGYNQNLSASNSLSPILRNAQAQSSYGQFLSQVPGVRSQYDNQNVGIINQFRQYNNQIGNNARAQNMQNDQQYYQQSVTANVNFDNMKTFLGDQYMNNLMGDVQDNQSLAYNLATLNNPAYNYDFRTGNYRANPNRNLLDVQGNGRSDIQSEYIDKMMKNWDKLDNKDRINLLKIMTAKGFSPTVAKKGGKVGHNPYK